MAGDPATAGWWRTFYLNLDEMFGRTCACACGACSMKHTTAAAALEKAYKETIGWPEIRPEMKLFIQR